MLFIVINSNLEETYSVMRNNLDLFIKQFAVENPYLIMSLYAICHKTGAIKKITRQDLRMAWNFVKSASELGENRSKY